MPAIGPRSYHLSSYRWSRYFLPRPDGHTTFSERQPRLFFARFSLPLPRLFNWLSPSLRPSNIAFAPIR